MIDSYYSGYCLQCAVTVRYFNKTTCEIYTVPNYMRITINVDIIVGYKLQMEWKIHFLSILLTTWKQNIPTISSLIHYIITCQVISSWTAFELGMKLYTLIKFSWCTLNRHLLATCKGRSVTGVTCEVMLHCIICHYLFIYLYLMPCLLTGTSPKGVAITKVTITILIKVIVNFDNSKPQPY